MPTANSALPPLPPLLYEEIIRRALAEDLGLAGDLTTDAIVSPGATAMGVIIARNPGRVAGIDIAGAVFQRLDRQATVEISLPDGCDAAAGDILATIRGSARAILTAERTALNLIGRLSGIATVTRDIVRAVASYGSKIVCTRKTTPGLRALEKYAVRAGGGANHRFGLADAVLIKDNHRLIAGGVAEAVRRVRQYVGHMVKIEVEVDTLDELQEALAQSVDAVLLDNMTPEMLALGVRMAKGKAITEASGGITAANAPAVAATGVDLISIGWITHSVPALDVSLEIQKPEARSHKQE